MKWMHSRKGIIEGDIVKDDGDWVDIKLDSDQKLRYLSFEYMGTIDYRNDILRVRKSFLTEIPGPTTHDHAALVKKANTTQ